MEMTVPGFLAAIHLNFAERGDQTAFYIKGRKYSYAELAFIVAGIQQSLLPHARECHVGIYLADDVFTYASILALWMNGQAFVPLNAQFPPDRNREIIGQMGLKLLLHSEEGEELEAFHGMTQICTRKLAPADSPLLESRSAGNDAYVLFTSGSTGKAKGVRISFSNLDAFVRDFIACPSYDFSHEERFLQIYDLSFDASVHCYTVPLVLGATVYTVPPDGIKYLAAYKLMREHRLTFVKMPPSTLSYLKPHFDSIRLPELRYCLFGGEAFPADLVAEWEACVPNALIQNVYGPTEATINCSIYDWNRQGSRRKQKNGIASIGKTFGTNRLKVLKSNGDEAGAGEEGELLLGGEQISPGYWEQPQLTEKAFVELEEEGLARRYYHSGDIVMADEEGDLMFIGRADEQVQVRGYRVELGEIEALVRKHLPGSACMAAGLESTPGNMRICLAIELPPGDSESLLSYLQRKLPPYMLPEHIVFIPHFPRLVSGKLDRRTLKNMLSDEVT